MLNRATGRTDGGRRLDFRRQLSIRSEYVLGPMRTCGLGITGGRLAQKIKKRIRVDSRWVPPRRDVVKVNFDGPIFQAMNGIEAMAAVEALRFSRSMGWRRIHVEGDCANLIWKLNSPDLDLSIIGNLVAHFLAREARIDQESALDLPSRAHESYMSDLDLLQ
ncbi:hypothetical protein BUALT_Bualt09G0049000 [Buddleja alternifolia]|uniref:RNase H type-1 domain-containing protein n=1 Tax=Buddleja alternifolia TaxID=168488 RepID=A0AAV6WZD5_9LAMI|nr:hypothetical protein BUALT_Bualt09G0049000 [Buddleja alternifolia]